MLRVSWFLDVELTSGGGNNSSRHCIIICAIGLSMILMPIHVIIPYEVAM